MDSFQCGKCGETKPLADFPRGEMPKFRTSTCKKCRAEWAREWRSRPERHALVNSSSREWGRKNPNSRKRRSLWEKYGITIDEYDAMIMAQDNKCVVCNSKQSDFFNKKRRELCVDHCHKTGRVRGLLCGPCNRALGLVKENPATLAMMRAYLYMHTPPEWREPAAL